jgi:hypothetical protein
MKKIAVTGATAQDRMLIVQALSYLTGYDVVRQTAFSCQAIKYDLSKEIEECSWSDLFVYALSSFTERIGIEQQYEKYISNGSVFHELSLMEAIHQSHRHSERESMEYSSMLSALKKNVSEYAIREYDCVIHLSGTYEVGGMYQRQDDNLKDLIQGCDKKFIVDEGFILSDILEEISIYLGVNPVHLPGTALRKAQQEVLRK